MPAASKAGAPNHRAAADRIIKRVRAIDQPRVSCELRESHYNSEQKKWHEQCAPPNDPKPDKQTIIDKI